MKMARTSKGMFKTVLAESESMRRKVLSCRISLQQSRMKKGGQQILVAYLITRIIIILITIIIIVIIIE